MFEAHKLSEQGLSEVETFKTQLAHVIREIDGLLPDGRERSIFLTKIEEAVFFGTKSIASKPGNYTEIKNY